MTAQGWDDAGKVTTGIRSTPVNCVFCGHVVDNRLGVARPHLVRAFDQKSQRKASPITFRSTSLLADNDSILRNPDDPHRPAVGRIGSKSTNQAVRGDLEGMYLSDNLNNLTKFRIAASLNVPAGGFLLFWADDETEQGPNHTSFKLVPARKPGPGCRRRRHGNRPVLLWAAVDRHLRRPLPRRYGKPRFFGTPTPDSARRLHSAPDHYPDHLCPPTALGQRSGHGRIRYILDEGDELSATLFYSVGVPFAGVPMVSDTLHHFRATIPPQPGNTWVAYYVSATDGDSMTRH